MTLLYTQCPGFSLHSSHLRGFQIIFFWLFYLVLTVKLADPRICEDCVGDLSLNGLVQRQILMCALLNNSSVLCFGSPTLLAEHRFVLVICCCLSAENTLLVSCVWGRYFFFFRSVFCCSLWELPHNTWSCILFASTVPSSLPSLGWVSFSGSRKYAACWGEPSDPALNTYWLSASPPRPCRVQLRACMNSLSESRPCSLHLGQLCSAYSCITFCSYCLTGTGCTQSKVSATRISENTADSRSEIPSLYFCWWRWPRRFPCLRVLFGGLLNCCFHHARGFALCWLEAVPYWAICVSTFLVYETILSSVA